MPLRDIGPLVDGDWILNADYTSDGVRLLQVGDVGAGQFAPKSNRYISHVRAQQLRCTMLKTGDILISRMPDPIGRACCLPQLSYDAITAVDVSIWRPDPTHADASYLVHALNSPAWYRLVESRASGATRPRISRTNLEALRVRLPPLAEQKRVATDVTRALKQVDATRRAADDRLAAAEALRAAYLREVFEGAEASTWKTQRLGELLRRYNEIIHPGDREGGETVFVGLEHIEPNTGRRLGSSTIDLGNLTGRKPTFRRGQIVYGYLRPYLNKVWIAEFDGCSSVDQFAFEVRGEIADTGFVAAFMRSATFLKRAQVVTTTGQLPRISIDEIEGVSIELPPTVSDQRRIASDLANRLKVTDSVVRHCRDELVGIEALSSAILRAVFNGDS